KLLKAALQKSSSVGADNGTEVEPVDDPNALSALLEDTNFPAASLNEIEQFERETYAFQMDTRIRIALDALRAIAPMSPDTRDARACYGFLRPSPSRSIPTWTWDLQEFAFIRKMAVTADALAVAKVAVYPMDPAGLQTQSMFQASARMRGNPVRGHHSIGRQIQREDQSRFNRQASMETLAEQT